MSQYGHYFSTRFVAVTAGILAVVAVGIFLIATQPAAPPVVDKKPPEPDKPPVEATTEFFTISIASPGTSTDLMDDTILLPISTALKSIDGVKATHSAAFEGRGEVVVAATTPDAAMFRQSIAEAMARLSPMLPEGVEPPVVRIGRTDRLPDVWLVLRSTGGQDLAYLSRVVRFEIVEAVQRIAGVESVEVIGEVKPRLVITLNAEKLKARNLELADLAAPLERKGDVTAITSADKLGEVKIADRDGMPVLLRDVADVRESVKPSGMATYGRGPAVAVGLYLHDGKDLNAVEAKLKALQQEWKKGLSAETETILLPASAHELLLEARAPEETLPLAKLLRLNRFEAELLAAFPSLPPTLVLQAAPELPMYLTASFPAGESRSRAVDTVRQIDEDTPDVSVRVTNAGRREPRWPIRFGVVGSDRPEKAAALVKQLRAGVPELTDAEILTAPQVQQQQMRIDREKTRAAGIGFADVTNAMQLMTAGLPNRPVPIEFRPPDREPFGDMTVKSSDGKLVPLGSLVTIEMTLEPARIDRADGERCVIITANLAPGKDRAEAIRKIESLAAVAKAKIILLP